MNTAPHTTHSLLPGQARHLALARGDVLMASRGALVLRAAPRWIAEGMHSPVHRLGEGEFHLVEESGWVMLEATSSAADACVWVASGRSAGAARVAHAAQAARAWLAGRLRRLAF